MEITRAEATTHTVPADVPGSDTPQEMTVTIVEVSTDEGITGYGETGYLHPTATASFINEEIDPRIRGSDPLQTHRIRMDLEESLNPRTQTGVWSTAVSAVDIACWDITGKALGEPVWRLLGGARQEVPTYVTIGQPIRDPDRLAETAAQLVDEGAKRLKVVVGAGEWATPAVDAARVEAVQEAIGDVPLAMDANYQYSLPEAQALCNRLDQSRIQWFEEPVAGNDPGLLEALRNRTQVPIAAGQNEGDRVRHRHLIEHDAVDVLLPNVCFVGGFTEAMTVAGLAHSFNVEIAHGGGWPYQNMHLHAGLQNGGLLELHDIVREIAAIIYEEPPTPTDGSLTLPDDPGLGLTPDRDALDRYRD